MKGFSTLVLAMTLASSSYGQRFLPGIKAGANFSRYTGNGTGNYQRLAGFHGGLVGNIPLSATGVFALQPELLYSQKGAEVEQSGSRFTSRMHYLELPVLARINTAGFIIEAGPQLGYLLSHDNRFTGPAVSVKHKKIDVGYAVGVGYQLTSGPSIGLRYNGGVSTIFSEVIAGTVNPKNEAFQLYVGYLFGAKK
jgi:Outer membrane protein beta-barrel domain